ncbi:hypothetical protein L195_g056402, partial [Trifolium pratense]
VEPVTASGLIRAGGLQNAKAAESDAAQTYSAAVNWKSPTLGRFKYEMDCPSLWSGCWWTSW